jgi:hypothetical protein
MVKDMQADSRPHPWKNFEFIFEGIFFAAGPLHVWDFALKEHSVTREVSHVNHLGKFLAVKVRKVNFDRFCEAFRLDRKRYWLSYVHVTNLFLQYLSYLMASITDPRSGQNNVPLKNDTMLPVRLKLSIPENTNLGFKQLDERLAEGVPLPLNLKNSFREAYGAPRTGERLTPNLLRTKLNSIRKNANIFKANIESRDPSTINNSDKRYLQELYYAMLSSHAAIQGQNYKTLNNTEKLLLARKPNVKANTNRLPNIAGVNKAGYNNTGLSEAAGNLNNKNLTGFNQLTLTAQGLPGGKKNTSKLSTKFLGALRNLQQEFGSSTARNPQSLPMRIQRLQLPIREQISMNLTNLNNPANKKKSFQTKILGQFLKALPPSPGAPMSNKEIQRQVRVIVRGLVDSEFDRVYKNKQRAFASPRRNTSPRKIRERSRSRER